MEYITAITLRRRAGGETLFARETDPHRFMLKKTCVSECNRKHSVDINPTKTKLESVSIAEPRCKTGSITSPSMERKGEEKGSEERAKKGERKWKEE